MRLKVAAQDCLGIPIGATLYAAFITLVFFAMAGCSRPAETSAGIRVNAKLAPEPARVGPGTVTVELQDAAAQPVRGAHIAVEANMTHPGMAPIFRDAREIEPGRYQADLELGMRGDWVILLHIRLSNGKKLERQMNLNAIKAE